MTPSDWQIEDLPLAAIRPNPYQPRRHIEEGALGELAASIMQYGVLQPVTVRRAGGGFFELIAGERRVRAARLAGLESVPALVRCTFEQDAAVLALVENLQREQLHYLEEAEGYINLAQEHGMTQELIAERVGKTQAAVCNKMRIMRLPRAVRESLASFDSSERHARALLRLPNEADQLAAATDIREKGLSVRDAERLVERLLAGERPALPRMTPQMRRLFRDTRLLTNSCKTAIDALVKAGLSAGYEERDCGDYTLVSLRLPKAPGRRQPESAAREMQAG